MHVRTLGRAQLSAGDTVVGPDAHVTFPLLLHLVLERDRWVPRRQLQEMLFPEQDYDNARHSLRQAVYKLRKEGFPIEGSGPALHIPGEEIEDDYTSLLSPQMEGERDLSGVLGGWLAGFEPTISPSYSHWFEAKRNTIGLQMRSALLAELAVHKRHGRWGQCERTCRAILTLDPLNEEATLGLAEALALTGSKLQAIRVLERYQEEMPTSDLRLPARILKRRISERLPERPGERGHPRLVGRDREMQQLTSVIDSVRSGTPTAALITGDAGIGKTRLLHEGEQWAALHGFTIASHVCRPHDVRKPLGIFSSLVPRLRTLPGALGCAPDALAILQRFDSVPEPSLATTLLSNNADDVAAAVSWAIEELVSAVAGEAPLLVSVDDIHWGDDASLALFPGIASGSNRRIVVLLSGRQLPAVLRGEAAKHFTTIALSALAPDAARALILSELALAARPADEAVTWAEPIAAGNPLFLITLARHSAEHPESRALPTELTHLLEERLRDLSATETQVFAMICALGRYSTFANLENALGLPAHELLLALDRLDIHGFANAANGYLEPSHPMLAEGVLQRLAPSARKYLYHAASTVLESLANGTEDTTLLWDLVQLTLKSGQQHAMVTRALDAARHAVSIGRPSAACDLLEEVSASSTTPSVRALVSADLLIASRSAGRWRSVRDLARGIAPDATLPTVSRDELIFAEAEAEWHLTHEYFRIVPALRSTIASAVVSAASRLRAAELLLISAVNLGDRDLARVALDASMAPLGDDQNVTRTSIRMIYEMSFGDMAAAEAGARRLIAHVRSSPLTMTSMRLLSNSASVLAYSGHRDEALEALSAGFRESQRANVPAAAYRCAHDTVNWLLLSDRIEEAKEWFSIVVACTQQADAAVDVVLADELGYWISAFEGDYERAYQFSDSLDRWAQERSGRTMAITQAIRALACVQTGRFKPMRAEEDALVQNYLDNRGFIESELWTWAVCEILRYGGRLDEAQALAVDYVNNGRRERTEVASRLRHYLPEN